MKKWITRLLVVASIVVTLWVLQVWVFAPEPLVVTTIPVERGLVQETVTNSRAGTVKARLRSHLSPEIGGRVVEIPYRKGARVKKGDILLRLSDAAQRATLLRAERELAMAKAQRDRACLEADRAQRVYDRNRGLAEKGLISSDEIDQLQNTLQTATASCQEGRVEIERARAAIVQAKAELDKTVLRAPFDGIVAELDTEVGEWATPSPPALPIPPVLDIINPSSIYVSAPMDEVDSARIRPGQPTVITLDPFPGKSYMGRVTRVAPFVEDIEEQNRTVDIDVEFLDKAFAATLLPGTSADVEVILQVKENVLRIPTPTLLEGNKVFIVEAGHLKERSVNTGLKNWDYVEIITGLSAGEAVVTSLDREGISAGTPVEVEEEALSP